MCRRPRLSLRFFFPSSLSLRLIISHLTGHQGCRGLLLCFSCTVTSFNTYLTCAHHHTIIFSFPILSDYLLHQIQIQNRHIHVPFLASYPTSFLDLVSTRPSLESIWPRSMKWFGSLFSKAVLIALLYRSLNHNPTPRTVLSIARSFLDRLSAVYS